MAAVARPRKRKLKDGTIREDWFVYVNDKKRIPENNGRRATQCKSEAEAKRVAAEWNRQVEEEETPRFAGPKDFESVAKRWWEQKSGLWRETSRNSRDDMVKRLVARIGKRDIRELTEDAIENVVKSLCPPHTEYARATVTGTMDVLSTIVGWAVGRMIKEHPCNVKDKTIRAIGRRVAKALCPLPESRDAYTYEESRILIAHCWSVGQNRRTRNVHWLHDAALFALRTGCRIGEQAALQWKDLDVERGILTVRASRAYRETTATKNSQARSLSLAPDILAHVREMHARRKDDGYVFRNSQGKPMNADGMSSAWPKVRRRCKGVPDYEWHAWRHTWASMALDRGWTPGQAAAYIGDTEEVFRKHYAHLIRDKHLDLNFFDVPVVEAPQPQTPKAAPKGRLTLVQ